MPAQTSLTELVSMTLILPFTLLYFPLKQLFFRILSLVQALILIFDDLQQMTCHL